MMGERGGGGDRKKFKHKSVSESSLRGEGGRGGGGGDWWEGERGGVGATRRHKQTCSVGYTINTIKERSGCEVRGAGHGRHLDHVTPNHFFQSLAHLKQTKTSQ